jgi:hypothetical protein
VPLYTNEELVELYGAVEVDTMAALAGATSAVNDLEPPDEFEADHELLQTWLEDTTGAFDALFQATGEDDRNERANLQEQGRIAFCTAADDFSPLARPLVDVVFDSPLAGGPANDFCP